MNITPPRARDCAVVSGTQRSKATWKLKAIMFNLKLSMREKKKKKNTTVVLFKAVVRKAASSSIRCTRTQSATTNEHALVHNQGEQTGGSEWRSLHLYIIVVKRVCGSEPNFKATSTRTTRTCWCTTASDWPKRWTLKNSSTKSWWVLGCILVSVGCVGVCSLTFACACVGVWTFSRHGQIIIIYCTPTFGKNIISFF